MYKYAVIDNKTKKVLCIDESPYQINGTDHIPITDSSEDLVGTYYIESRQEFVNPIDCITIKTYPENVVSIQLISIAASLYTATLSITASISCGDLERLGLSRTEVTEYLSNISTPQDIKQIRFVFTEEPQSTVRVSISEPGLYSCSFQNLKHYIEEHAIGVESVPYPKSVEFFVYKEPVTVEEEEGEG